VISEIRRIKYLLPVEREPLTKNQIH
jgi:hypothetical protein